MGFVASSFNELDFSPLVATVLFRRKDTYGVFAEPVDPDEVKNPYSFAMLAGVANLFGTELLSIDIAVID